MNPSLFAAYVVGILGGLVVRACLWKTPEKPWRDYPREHPAEAYASPVIALLSFGLWASGMLAGAAGGLHGVAHMMMGEPPPTADEKLVIPINWMTTLPAGAVIDFIAVQFAKRLDKKASGD